MSTDPRSPWPPAADAARPPPARPAPAHGATVSPLPRSAGVRLFDPAAAACVEGAERVAAAAIEAYLMLLRLPVDGLRVRFDAALGLVRLSGRVPDAATRDELIVRCRRVQGVLAIQDGTSIAPLPPPRR